MQAQYNFDFLGKRHIAITLSLILVALSVFVWIQKGSSKYGIDFLGGHEVVIDIPGVVDTEKLAQLLEAKGLAGASVQAFEKDSADYSIRVVLAENKTSKEVISTIEQVVKENFKDKSTILKTDSVGAVIGSEIRTKAIWAIALGIIGILIYIAFRFEFAYGVGAVVAVFHDVIISTGAYLLAGHQINGASLAAALTILGYSVNDTIVVFDRAREELRKNPRADLKTVLNDASNFCLSRTIITSGLTLFAALALFIFGGGAIQDLSLFLVVGIIVGSYSTIFIASPVVLWWQQRNLKKA